MSNRRRSQNKNKDIKLKMYINQLIRNLEKKLGKVKTRALLGVHRDTLNRWTQEDAYGLNTDNLEHVCRKYATIYTHEEAEELFIQGLFFLVKDRFENKI